MDYKNLKEIANLSIEQNKKISDIVLIDQSKEMSISENDLYKKMEESFDVMLKSIEQGLDKDLKSTSKLSGGDSYRMLEYSKNNPLMGTFLSKALANCLAVSEYNSSMGKIVAAPTAGSCGILPGAICTLFLENMCKKDEAIMSLFTASAIGMVIAKNATIAGAEGGCQAECGAASAMTAGALVEVCKGSVENVLDACAFSIKNTLGLVCDPVAGLVEVPCIKRNVGCLSIAFSSANMALSGIKSKIPFDECVLAMKEVGSSMPTSLKETACGGLATTPTGLNIKNMLFGE